MRQEAVEQILASDLALGDIVRVFDGPFGDGVVRKITTSGAVIFRPYATTDDFSYTGGVIPYIGVEEFTLYHSAKVDRLRKGGEKR